MPFLLQSLDAVEPVWRNTTRRPCRGPNVARVARSGAPSPFKSATPKAPREDVRLDGRPREKAAVTIIEKERKVGAAPFFGDEVGGAIDPNGPCRRSGGAGVGEWHHHRSLPRRCAHRRR